MFRRKVVFSIMRFCRIYFLSMLALLAGACGGSDFSGGGQQAKKSLSGSGPASDGTASPLPGGGGGGGGGGRDELIEACKRQEMVEDPNATFVFQKGEARTFINSQAAYTRIPETGTGGSVHADKESADAVCRIKGYLAASNYTTRPYDSCEDNTHAYWIESIKNFEIRSACDNNIHILILTCKGLLKEPCRDDPAWVFGK